LKIKCDRRIMKRPTHQEMLKIAVEATLSYNTVITVYKGGGHIHSQERVRKAAEKLGFPEPEVKCNICGTIANSDYFKGPTCVHCLEAEAMMVKG
jgi:hypothetical protein